MSPFGHRILILAPHPDDEILGASAAVARAAGLGATLFVRFLTTGVVAPALMWPWERRGHGARVARRQAEARAAVARLGLTILGFSPIPTRSLRLHLEETRTQVRADLESLAVDRLWVPAFEGAHQDHDAANALAATLTALVPVWEYACYGFAGGQVRAQEYPAPRGQEVLLPLSAEEKAAKAALLALYASEQGNLGHAGNIQEAFRPLPNHDYRAPPHEGLLFWQRFQWVPFRHPRVDFTPAADVYPRLHRFLVADTNNAIDTGNKLTEY